jgi:soluble lytic murein transglycosylase-like protein
MEYAQLVSLAKETAKVHALDPALICAIIEQESDFVPWAIRHEPAFDARYVKPLNLADTEEVARSISWGLMQLMGEAARELGFRDHLASLCDPFVGIEWGCRHFSNKLKVAGGDVTRALLLWNGGGNKQYPDQVLARRAKFLDVQTSATGGAQ